MPDWYDWSKKTEETEESLPEEDLENSVDDDEEKWVDDLKCARDVVYYYGINENDLMEEGALYRKITDYVKSKLDEGTNISYGVFKTTYDQKFCYCIKYSSVVQSYTELDDQDIG